MILCLHHPDILRTIHTKNNIPEIIYKEDLLKNLHVCPRCEIHHKVSCHERFNIFFDNGIYTTLATPQPPDDPLEFSDKKNILKDLRQRENLLTRMMLS